MSKKLSRIVLWTVGVLIPVALSAAIARADGPAISGFIDTQYIYNFNQPKDGMNRLRSYDAKDNTITLNTAHLNFVGTMGDVGYVIETDMGTDATVNSSLTSELAAGSGGTGTADDFDIQEAYLTWKFGGGKWGIKAGKFVTPNGIEVVESKDDATISRGYLFNFAECVSHVGGLLSFALNDKFDIAAGVINGWDLTTDNNNSKTVLGKIGINFGDPLSVTISGYHGSEQPNTWDDPATTGVDETIDADGNNRDTIDLTGVTKLIPKVALWFQVNHGEEKRAVPDPVVTTELERAIWSGAGLQPIISVTDKFSVGARIEYFDDKDGARMGKGRDVYATNFSVTPGYKLADNLTLRAEYRYDTANQKIFIDDEGTAKDSQSTGSLQFIVTF